VLGSQVAHEEQLNGCLVKILQLPSEAALFPHAFFRCRLFIVSHFASLFQLSVTPLLICFKSSALLSPFRLRERLNVQALQVASASRGAGRTRGGGGGKQAVI
jgi:hypothetical protein